MRSAVVLSIASKVLAFSPTSRVLLPPSAAVMAVRVVRERLKKIPSYCLASGWMP